MVAFGAGERRCAKTRVRRAVVKKINSVPGPEHFTVRWFAVAALVAVATNFAWEMAQAYLYAPMGDAWQATWRCVVASIADGAIVVFVLAIARRPWTSARASYLVEYVIVVALALAAAAAIEWWGLTQGRWAYGPGMPRIPGTGLGVVPLAQLALLTPLSMSLADRTTVHQRE